MIWLIVTVFIALAAVFFFNSYQNKYQSFQGVVFNFIIVGVLLFLIFSVAFVYTTSEVSLKSLQGVLDFGKLYFSWLGQFFVQSKNAVGYVINQNWGVNSTSG
jgi:hypothetical protein